MNWSTGIQFSARESFFFCRRLIIIIINSPVGGAINLHLINRLEKYWDYKTYIYLHLRKALTRHEIMNFYFHMNYKIYGANNTPMRQFICFLRIYTHQTNYPNFLVKILNFWIKNLPDFATLHIALKHLFLTVYGPPLTMLPNIEWFLFWNFEFTPKTL